MARSVAGAMLALLVASGAGTAMAQDGAAPRAGGSTGAFQRTGSETERHQAAAAAASWGIAVCSGLWDGGQTMEMITRDNPQRGGVPMDTLVDDKARTVSVAYDEAMPPRHVVWRPVMGCVQLPPGAGLDAAKHLPQVDSSVQRPNFDDQKWPMGDRDATAKLPKFCRAKYSRSPALCTNEPSPRAMEPSA